MDQVIDLANRFLVGEAQGNIVIGRIREAAYLSPDEALVLAAWLVAIAEPFAGIRFDDLRRDVEDT